MFNSCVHFSTPLEMTLYFVILSEAQARHAERTSPELASGVEACDSDLSGVWLRLLLRQAQDNSSATRCVVRLLLRRAQDNSSAGRDILSYSKCGTLSLSKGGFESLSHRRYPERSRRVPYSTVTSSGVEKRRSTEAVCLIRELISRLRSK